MILYYSQNCSSCARLMSIIQRIASLRNKVEYQDIHTVPPSQRSSLQYVPTVVDDNGQQHVGYKAFDFMKQYEQEIELQSAPLSFGTLTFSALEGYGESEYAEHFGDFVAPPP